MKFLSLVILCMFWGVESASILAVTTPSRAQQIKDIIQDFVVKRNEFELTKRAREVETLHTYLDNNNAEKVAFKDLAEAVVNGLSTAFLGKGVSVRGMVSVLQLGVGWAAAHIPNDLVAWVLGRHLRVSDLLFVETVIEDLFECYSTLERYFGLSLTTGSTTALTTEQS